MANLPKTQMVTLIICNDCQHAFVTEMPLIEEVHQIVCIHCESVMTTNKDQCCVYCSYGSEKCPKMQLWDILRSSLDSV